MGLLFVLLIGGAIARGDITWERVALLGCVVIVVFIATFEMVLWTTGFDLLQAFRQIGAHAVEFNTLEARAYRTWVWANLGEFLFGTGPAQVVLALAALAHSFTSARGWRESLRHPLTLTCVGLFAVLITTDLLGLNRGEVVRLWIFLACFFQIPAAWLCAATGDRTAITVVLLVSLLQISIAAAMIRFVIT